MKKKNKDEKKSVGIFSVTCNNNNWCIKDYYIGCGCVALYYYVVVWPYDSLILCPSSNTMDSSFYQVQLSYTWG